MAVGVVLAGAADARPGQLVQLSGSGACVSQLDTVALCASGRALNAPDALAVSPDGRSLYVASFGVSERVAGNTGSLAAFARNPQSGRISQPAGMGGCIGAVEAGCAAGRALEGTSGVTVSPDGRNVYVSSLVSSAVSVFARAETGRLAQGGCVSEGGAGGCTAGRALEQPTDVAISRDGRNVYVASFGSRAVAAFTRGANGQLAQLGCVAQSDEGGTIAGCTPAQGLTNPNSLAVSPDGASVYALSDDALAVLRRSATGALTPAGCLSADGSGGACTPYPALAPAIDVAVSPDGANVYVTTYSPGAILIFRRNAQTGALAPLAPVTTGVALDGVADVAVSPDGANVYAASPFSDAVLAFARAAGGRLRQLADDAACIGDVEAGTGCAAGEVMTRASTLAISPEGRHLYVTSVQAIGPACACGEELGTVSVFSREVAPKLAFVKPAVPSAIRAGRGFTIRLALETTGMPRIGCVAKIGNKPVPARPGYSAGAATCSGIVPKGTTGKRLTVTFTGLLGTLARRSAWSFPIRP